MPTVGILAGEGNLPLVFAERAVAHGYRIVVVGYSGKVMPELAQAAHAAYPIPLGQWQSIIDVLKQEKIEDVYILGGVSKRLLFSNIQLDERVQRLIGNLKEKNDNAIIEAFVADLAREGLIVRPQCDLLEDIMPGPGVLTSMQPDESDWADIYYGWRVAKALAGLDIGQTVVVKDGAVLALEAIDGTDATIARGGALAQGGGVAVKVAKPSQDIRYDLPTIGPSTLETVIDAGLRVIALEAGKTLVIDSDTLIQRADAAGICIVLVDYQDVAAS
ncbi:MAG: LpxI family protein [Firmicutes bacterium]|nr:LpxI family protein [Bacillota bacterium]